MRVQTRELTEQELIHVLSLPDLSWHTCGPIIEREKIAVSPFYKDWIAAKGVSENITDQDGDRMTVVMWESEPHYYGPTPLIAAVRCYVATCLGNEVDIPDELA